MTAPSGARLARAALALAGTRFRFRGRNPETGVDCIGVFACAARSIGLHAAVPVDYQWRMRDLGRIDEWAMRNGFAAVNGRMVPGDVVIVATGVEQGHLAIAVSEGNFVHAHAGLGRVVCAPLPPEWRIIGHWRLARPVETENGD